MSESTTDKATILVVDDSRLMRVAARKILKSDFEVLEAEDGEVAWDLLQGEQNIDLVMSDLSMPNLDGLGLLKMVRESSDQRIKDLPVIIVTGAEDDDGSKSIALAAGASDFITKPFESVELLARAKSQAEQKRTQQALRESETSKQILEDQSSVDPLTGLSNQRAFKNCVEERLSYSIRHRTELALLLLQVDKFKVLFLRRGKQTAEDVLCRLAQLLGECRRREDTVARLGLDTFGILLPSANLVGAKRIATQLHQTIKRQTFNVGDVAVDVKVTIAVSSPVIDARTSCAEFLADADEKLKIAQKAGGDRVQHTLDETTPEEPDNEPAIVEASLGIANSEEVQHALQALATGDTMEGPADELARGVLPILQAWNKAHGNRHNDLITQLERVLQGVEQEPALATPPPDTRAESL